METLKFKTTIKCMGCVSKATPFLNEVVGSENWKVDVNNPDKVLEVTANGNTAASDVVKAVQEAGFKAEPIQ
ncbi:hypothetical protein KACHI17_20840 [Sediminibacterium sp. KACHI17]|jgi:copper chaperone|uniref:HMA domain-containing protein n=1 Tax=Sediminibacterium sp. KACHI17 TaxID=1751071 RepID=A0AAT9GKK0_9BACT